MQQTLLALTPSATLSRGLRTAWIAALALSPLAYLGGTLLESKLAHEARFVTISRDKAIELAKEFARSRGIEPQDWVAGTTVQGHGATATFFRGAHPAALERVFAPATIDVILNAQKDRHWLKVSLAPNGRLLGFVGNKPPKGATIEESSARSLAEESIRRQLGSDNPFRMDKLTARSIDKDGWNREFVWEAGVPDLPGGTTKFHVEVAGDQVVSQNSTLHLPDAIQKQNTKGRTGQVILAIAMAIYFILLGGYAIYRYAQRSIEREVSHRRTLLVVAIFAISGIVSLGMNGADAAASINGESATGVKLILLLVFGMGIPGVLFGVAYGAGEGDLREAYPGKLASVDAFLCGRWLSSNCARSILTGGAFAGWLLLILNTLLFLGQGPPVGDASEAVKMALQRSPLTAEAASVFTDLTLMTAFGLMLPLTFLRSRIHRPGLVYGMVFAFAVLVANSVSPSGHSWQNNLVLDLVYGVAIFAPFFFGDLLAAVSCLTALEFVHILVRKSAISDQWHSIAYGQVLPVGIAFLLIELFFAWRGRWYDEAEVRPLYARHLVERLALTAEIGAARLAQVRLLPDSPPRITGLSIAGSCVPAREVGGDFFDYHTLDDHRLGIFLAEGGSRELGSAMAIALAKGYLMYTARLDLTPVEILRRLRTTLGSVLRGENASMTVLYAVVDGRNRTLRYARAGASPRVVINGTAMAEEIVADRVDGIEIRHGAATLAANDALFFYTDGWAGQIVERTRRGPHEFLRNLSRQFPEVDADALHKAALEAAIERRQSAPPDDVTAVVVRMDARLETAVEAVGGIA